jgi:pimeloyl-ACP methyl ester carboxylesterase
MTPQVKPIALTTGVSLRYVEQGDPLGVPVLLLHGITDSWRSFELVLPHLPASVRAFALSQRGHGDADRPATGYRPQDFAADLAAFMDGIDLERAVVAGHSMGASIAQRFAIDHPERTLGLVLVGALPTWRGHPDFAALWDSAVSTLTDPIDPSFVRAFQESTLAGPVPPEFLETVVRESLKLPARVWRAVLREGLLEPDFSGALGKIRAPTVVLWGDQDSMTAGGQDSLVRAIDGSQLVVYAGAGHALHWEEPERFAADLATFAHTVVR